MMGSGDASTEGQHLLLAWIPNRQLTAPMSASEALRLLDALLRDANRSALAEKMPSPSSAFPEYLLCFWRSFRLYYQSFQE